MPEILSDYLVYLKQKNYSAKTIKIYSYDLMVFLKFIKEYKDMVDVEYFNIFILMQVKEWDIDAYLFYLSKEKQNGSVTRSRKIIIVRMFFNYLILKYPNQIQDNPVKEKYIQKTIRFPKYLSLEQAKKLIGIFNKENSKYPERDNLIIQIILTTGIRKSEILNIDIKDIDFKNNQIKIKGKGNKDRFIYMPRSTRMKIKTFIQGKDKSIPLFMSNQNKRLSGTSIEYIVKKAINLIGLKGYSVHSLRHTFATVLYKQTNDILVVKEALGHQSISSTQIYTHIDSNYMKNIVDRNPLNIKEG